MAKIITLVLISQRCTGDALGSAGSRPCTPAHAGAASNPRCERCTSSAAARPGGWCDRGQAGLDLQVSAGLSPA